ncbi:hypothetical protein DFR42_11835 [Undibacterium pigrum]|uniref:Uncharacterized protein n=1 Tax=Undibacterium pigrum TaxID=401470 RepID=A0A318IQ02_9BURK|nr:hypothetical protein DFR42_11835 [Undibacterium pigrum]
MTRVSNINGPGFFASNVQHRGSVHPDKASMAIRASVKWRDLFCKRPATEVADVGADEVTDFRKFMFIQRWQ